MLHINDDDLSNLDELAMYNALAELTKTIGKAQTQKKALLQQLWERTRADDAASGGDQPAGDTSSQKASNKPDGGIEPSNDVIDTRVEEYVRKVQVCAMPSILAYLKSAGVVFTNARPGNRVAAVMRNSSKYKYDPKKETWSLRKDEEKVFKMRA